MPKISDRSDIGNWWLWAGFVSAPCVAVSVRQVAWSVQQHQPGGGGRGGSGNNTCECFIESYFNVRIRVIFRQDRLIVAMQKTVSGSSAELPGHAVIAHEKQPTGG